MTYPRQSMAHPWVRDPRGFRVTASSGVTIAATMRSGEVGESLVSTLIAVLVAKACGSVLAAKD